MQYHNVSDLIGAADESLAIIRIDVIPICHPMAEIQQPLFSCWGSIWGSRPGGNLLNSCRGSCGGGGKLLNSCRGSCGGGGGCWLFGGCWLRLGGTFHR